MTIRSVLATAVALVLAFTGCNQSGTGPSSELAAARARWLQGAPSAYSYTIRRSCECLAESAGPVTVVVRNGVVESRQYVTSGAAVGTEYAGVFPSVEGLFAIIENGIREGIEPLTAVYDAELGYPSRFAVGDPAADAPLYIVTDFARR